MRSGQPQLLIESKSKARPLRPALGQDDNQSPKREMGFGVMCSDGIVMGVSPSRLPLNPSKHPRMTRAHNQPVHCTQTHTHTQLRRPNTHHCGLLIGNLFADWLVAADEQTKTLHVSHSPRLLFFPFCVFFLSFFVLYMYAWLYLSWSVSSPVQLATRATSRSFTNNKTKTTAASLHPLWIFLLGLREQWVLAYACVGLCVRVCTVVSGGGRGGAVGTGGLLSID